MYSFGSVMYVLIGIVSMIYKYAWMIIWLNEEAEFPFEIVLL